MAKNKTPKADRLPLGKFLAWKSSDITSAGVFLIVTTYMSLFCTDYLGMTPLAVGNIILISNIIDFFTDLIAAYFDASINRISAWTVGFRNVQKALLMALCTPNLTAMQNADNWTELMVIQEELKTMPFGEIWTEYCHVCGAPADGEWFADVKKYEAEVLSKRG